MIAAISLVACSESNEEKAEKLIKKEMNKILVNIDSYEPIVTNLDTAYAPLMTADMFDFMNSLPNKIELYAKLQEDIKDAERKMDIFQSVSQIEYNQYKEQYESSYKRFKDLEAELTKKNQEVEAKAKEEKVFNGFLAGHKYRYVTKDGEKTIGQLLFLINKDFTSIDAMMDLEDEKMQSIFELYNINITSGK